MAFVDGSAASPLCWWTPAQLAAMGGRLHGPWAQWLAGWMPGGGSLLQGVHCALAWLEPERPQAAAWAGLGARGASEAWLAGAADGTPACFGLLFGKNLGGEHGAHAQSMARRIAPQAQQDLLDALRQALALDAAPAQEPPPAALLRPWSGGVVVTLGQPLGRHIRLLLNHAAAAQLLGELPATAPAAGPGEPASALEPVQSAVAGQALVAKVELAGCELDFGTLAGLRVGDVISLAHPLDAPLRVSVAGAPVCAGFLGRRGAARAIELVRDAAPAGNPQPLQP